MIYQRHIPQEELVSAQMEMLMQNGRRSTISLHFVGIVAAVVMFWSYLPVTTVLLWAAAFLVLLGIITGMLWRARIHRILRIGQE